MERQREQSPMHGPGKEKSNANLQKYFIIKILFPGAILRTTN